MLESIIQGYKTNRYRTPDVLNENNSIGQFIGATIFLYFQPIINIYDKLNNKTIKYGSIKK